MNPQHPATALFANRHRQPVSHRAAPKPVPVWKLIVWVVAATTAGLVFLLGVLAAVAVVVTL